MGRHKRGHKEVSYLNEVIANNGVAEHDHKVKKNITFHDLKYIKPLNEPQKQMVESFCSGLNVVAAGSAGGGKSYMALYLALNEILSPNSACNHIKIVRSPVLTREIGFLPGDASQKTEVFEIPYRDIVDDLIKSPRAYDTLKDSDRISFTPTSSVRGLTWTNTIVIFDEVQSANFHEISSVITRLGKNSRLIICGDTKQDDLIYKKNDVSGMKDFLKAASRMSSFDVIEFTTNDIVRSGLVKEWLTVCEELFPS